MPLPVTMTIAGTIPLLICIFLWLTQRESFHVGFGIRLLKLSMFFYLVPVQLLYHILPNSIYYFFKFWEKNEIASDATRRLYIRDKVFIPFHEFYIWIPIWFILLITLWLIFTIIFTIVQTVKYRKIIKNISENTALIEKQKTYHVRLSKQLSTPYTIGFFRPFIVLPEETADSAYRETLCRHEYCHIKNHDTLVKFICLIIICLHFYNPFAYILLFMYNTLCEYVCDAYAVSNLNNSEKKNYAKLLVNFSTEDSSLPFIWRNGFAGSKSNIKRRIQYFMKKEKQAPFKKTNIILLTIITCLLCTTTIWAYKPIKTTNWDPKSLLCTEDGYIEFLSMEDAKAMYEKMFVDFSISDIMIESENGTYTPLRSENSSMRAVCNHSYKSQRIQQLIPASNGGCTVEIYIANVCTKCNYVKSRTFENSHSYANCLH